MYTWVSSYCVTPALCHPDLQTWKHLMLLLLILMKHGNMMNLLWMTSGNQTKMGKRRT